MATDLSNDRLGPSTWRAYLGATLATGAAVLARAVLGPPGETALPYLTVYPVLAVALWLGRFGPAAWAALLAALLVEAGAPWAGADPAAWRAGAELRLTTYAVALSALAGFGLALRAVRLRLERERARAEEEEDSRRRAAGEAARAGSRIDAIVRSASESIAVFGLDGRLLSWNPAAERMFGLPEAAALGRDFGTLCPPALRAEHDEMVRRVRAGESVAWETTRLRADGRALPVRISAAPMRDEAGQVLAVSATIEDIGERVRTARLLQQSEARARLALDVARLGTFSIDRETGTLEVDERCRAICGLPAAGPLAWADLMQRVHAEDRRLGESALAAAWSPGEMPPAQELRFLHPDGTVRWGVIRGQVLHDTGADGRPRDTFVGTVLDMTAARRAEQALQEADQRKDEFLATLAHELRNPLAPLVNSVELLRRAGESPAVRERALAVMERQLQHTVRLVNDLLDLSRVHQGRIELVMDTLRLCDVIEVGLETALPQIRAEAHVLELALPPPEVRVRGDAVRLSQVFTNLLNNAAKYTPRGGHIRVGARCAGQRVEVTVQDDGIGIAPAMQSRVFEMFAQVDRSASGSRGGLGIGLALSSRLLALHGGSLSVHSEGAGRGSTFTVSLPLAEGAPATSATEAGSG